MAKIDAYGIGRQETRHPRWERCAAPMSARERPVCFQAFSGISALASAAFFYGVTSSYGGTAEWRDFVHGRSAPK
jgi:hypothetical protein